MAIDLADITGLVLCGGRGTRMGGVDKGLQQHRGRPLALHALMRLQTQVGAVMINANRNLPAYEAMGVPVWPDVLPSGVDEYPGPLAGWLAGLEHCNTPYLATVPCDSPQFPPDLVDRLATELVARQADIAMAATLQDGQLQRQPVFCLMKCSLLENLVAYLQDGGRRVETWAEHQPFAHVLFDDTQAFFNANTLQDLQQLT
jgi:molybdenum cofactor guanylyltransferase